MKKTLTLCLFVFALFFGAQTTVAQNSKLDMRLEINAKASEKTDALRKYIKFDNNQRDQIFEALRDYNKSNYIIKHQKVAENGVDKKIKKIEAELENRIKNILDDEQYERYKTFPE